MKQYIVTINYAKGKVKIRVNALNEIACKQIVMEKENCPEWAIVKIREAMFYKKQPFPLSKTKVERYGDENFITDGDGNIITHF